MRDTEAYIDILSQKVGWQGAIEAVHFSWSIVLSLVEHYEIFTMLPRLIRKDIVEATGWVSHFGYPHCSFY